jgi:hypothetical protein
VARKTWGPAARQPLGLEVAMYEDEGRRRDLWVACNHIGQSQTTLLVPEVYRWRPVTEVSNLNLQQGSGVHVSCLGPQRTNMCRPGAPSGTRLLLPHG